MKFVLFVCLTFMLAISTSNANQSDEDPDMARLILQNLNLKKKVKEQNQRLDVLETEMKRKNIIIRGIPESEGENAEMLSHTVFNILKSIDVQFHREHDIDEIRRLGHLGTYSPNKPRPILLRLTTKRMKNIILQHRRALKNTGVYFYDDYTKAVQEQRSALIVEMKEAKEKGLDVYLVNNTLVMKKDNVTDEVVEYNRNHLYSEE